MRLNGSRFNNQPLNGAPRAPILGVGTALTALETTLAPTFVDRASSTSLATLGADFTPTVLRNGYSTVAVAAHTLLGMGTIKHAYSVGYLAVVANLYYQRTHLGAGTAVVGFTFDASVGTQRLAGAWELAAVARLPGARVRSGEGTALFGVQSVGAPSAARCGAGEVFSVEVGGDLGASLVRDGVRYAAGYGTALIPLTLTDTALRAQPFVGEYLVTASAIGYGRRVRSLTPSRAEVALTAPWVPKVLRFATGLPMPVALTTSGAANIQVPGQGQALVTVGGALAGKVIRNARTTDIVVAGSSTGRSTRLAGLRGTAVTTTNVVSLTARRLRRGSAELVSTLPAGGGTLLPLRVGRGVAAVGQVTGSGTASCQRVVAGNVFLTRVLGQGLGSATHLGEASALLTTDVQGQFWFASTGGVATVETTATLRGSILVDGGGTVAVLLQASGRLYQTLGGVVDVDAEVFVRPSGDRELTRPYQPRELLRAP